MYVTSARSKPYKVFSLFCGIYEIQSTDMYHDITTLSFRTLLWTNRRDDALIFKYTNTCLLSRNVYLILRSLLLIQSWRQESVTAPLLFLQEQMDFAGSVFMPIHQYCKRSRFSYFASVIITIKRHSSGLSYKIGFFTRHLSVREIVLLGLSQVGKRENRWHLTTCFISSKC